MFSIEEIIEDNTKEQLKALNIDYYTKTQKINAEIDSALAKYPSKSGGMGKNYPDIKLFLQTNTLRKIPVMIEIKGTKGKLAKLKNDEVENLSDKSGQPFPANCFLLNPPYSAAGKGFIFVERALKKMNKGKACIIIQENAGSGNGLPYTKDILTHSTLLASIKMPVDLFVGKSSVQTAIYLFDVGTPHNTKHLVKFIDFSNDGYTRAARKKAKASTNLKDTDNAKARYEELINVILYGSGYLHYYKEHFIEDKITLEGKDWTFAQHQVIDTKPKLGDFKKCVSEYLAWEVSNVLKNSKANEPNFP